ncbi:hypothetical protein ACTXGQ_00305 [Marinobacter sp. 1Y8]
MLLAIVIFLALGFIVGSLFWLRPSADERRRMHLRNQAVHEGFHVESVKGVLKDELGSGDPDEALYLYWKSWGRRVPQGVDGGSGPSVFVSGKSVAGLEEAEKLSLLTEAFKAWFIDSRGAGFVWDESSESVELERHLTQIKMLVRP